MSRARSTPTCVAACSLFGATVPTANIVPTYKHRQGSVGTSEKLDRFWGGVIIPTSHTRKGTARDVMEVTVCPSAAVVAMPWTRA